MPTPRRTNGDPVSRAELGAHLDNFDRQLASLHEKVDAIAEKLAAPQRWFGSRLAGLIDSGLIVAATATIAYIATHS